LGLAFEASFGFEKDFRCLDFFGFLHLRRVGFLRFLPCLLDFALFFQNSPHAHKGLRFFHALIASSDLDAHRDVRVVEILVFRFFIFAVAFRYRFVIQHTLNRLFYVGAT
jgi:hypothetical protein